MTEAARLEIPYPDTGMVQRETLDEQNAVHLMTRLFTVLSDQGHARLLVWLYLSGHDDPIGYGARMREIARTVHRLRRARGVDAPEEDTLFTVLLAGIALFGDAIAGAPLRRSAGLGSDPEANARRARQRKPSEKKEDSAPTGLNPVEEILRRLTEIRHDAVR